MLLNFHQDANLQIGKEIINAALEGDSTKYISNFRDVIFEAPEETDWSAKTRYSRRVLCYRALLFKAGLNLPPASSQRHNRFSTRELLTAMQSSTGDKAAEHVMAATSLQKST